MVEPTPLRPASLHEEVAARLRTMVFERQLAPGQWIDEMALAGDWQISRTPLREALKVLAAEGLVTLVPRQGRRGACRAPDARPPDGTARGAEGVAGKRETGSGIPAEQSTCLKA